MFSIKGPLQSYGEDFELTRDGNDLDTIRGLMSHEKATGRAYIGFLEDVDIRVGDWLNGKVTKNVFTIQDITVDSHQGKIIQQKGYYLTKVEYEEKEALRQPIQSIVYNLNGANTRVNNHSTDQSINVVNTSNNELFDEIKSILNHNVVNQDELHELRLLVNEMESK